jgi:transcriptional regulator with PAS, ATPase and Fis domain
MVANGQFHEDFYYCVSVIPIHVPPLRERPGDIEPLARCFLRKFTLQMGKPVFEFDPDVMDVLRAYPWPGNVRELENAIEHAVAVSSGHSGRVSLDQLPQSVAGVAGAGEIAALIPKEGLDFAGRMAQIEKQYLLAALRSAEGIRTRAADLLRMSHRSFRHYAKKYNI